MSELALVLWLVYFAVSVALRVFLQFRRTRSSGLRLMRSRPSSVQSLGEGLEVLAIAAGVAAAALAATVEPLGALDGPLGHSLGIALYVLGIVGVFVSQESMRSSWRIGQDGSERTELVTRGPFRFARNPIFTSLVVVQAGLALLVPSVLALAGLALLLLSIEIQVRLVEEPHLLAAHGDRYADYAHRTGRFLPRFGRTEERQGRAAAPAAGPSRGGR